jgi:hypothetical protein
MKNFLQILQFLPYILQGIITVESIAGAAAPGTTKKKILLDSIAGVSVAAGGAIPVPQIQLVATLIDSSVAALNAAGVFNHAAAPGVAAAGPNLE